MEKSESFESVRGQSALMTNPGTSPSTRCTSHPMGLSRTRCSPRMGPLCLLRLGEGGGRRGIDRREGSREHQERSIWHYMGHLDTLPVSTARTSSSPPSSHSSGPDGCRSRSRTFGRSPDNASRWVPVRIQRQQVGTRIQGQKSHDDLMGRSFLSLTFGHRTVGSYQMSSPTLSQIHTYSTLFSARCGQDQDADRQDWAVQRAHGLHGKGVGCSVLVWNAWAKRGLE